MLRCHGCSKELPKGGLKYVVEVRSFADFDGYIEDYPGDVEEGINDLLDVMESMDTDEIEEDVYAEHTYLLCKPCRDRFAKYPFHSSDFTEYRSEHKGTLH